jgi:capsular polysaccharide transport system permease protein
MDPNVSTAAEVTAETDLDNIRKEGLTGRQLRMARRIAQKHGLAVTSDFDAVRQLRMKGIDPFERSSILELVASGSSGGGTTPPPAAPTTGTEMAPLGKIQLPQAVEQKSRALTEPADDRGERRASEILRIQKEIASRRRKKLLLLFARLAVFILLPTILAGYYFTRIATPMYATNTEFVIQQASSQSGASSGLSGLFQGTSMATQQDATTVQSFLMSRAAMARLDEEYGYKAHFQQEHIDPIQRLPADASNEDLFKLYSKRVKIGYDPTEGIVKMEVVATTPEASQQYSEALLGYAEEVVDQLTSRLRADQMRGAQESYDEAEVRRQEALTELLRIQNEQSVLSADAEIQAIFSRIGNLEARRQEKVLELATLNSARRPNEARVNAVESEIVNLQELIDEERARLTEVSGSEQTLAQIQTELRIAEENYQFQAALVQQALTMMETARLEASRQVRYISLGVEPIAPDDPTYPKAFEDTLVAFLIFAGIYLLVSLTASVLREQVSA